MNNMNNNNYDNTQTTETSKEVKYSISSIITQMENCDINFNHPSQRQSGQWTSKMKGNLISDILQNNPCLPLVMAEQVMGNGSVVWNLDGKQRCTNVHSFAHDGFKIPKGIRRNIIRYQSVMRDENNNIIVDEYGMTRREWKEFDIANKKFSQLPRELQQRFMDYTFSVILFIGCSSEDIAYHIERFNDGKPMNQAQKGIVKIGEDYAMLTKNISNMDFFVDCCSFNAKAKTNGSIDRVVTDSIMAINFIDEWKPNSENACMFLAENATEDMFFDLEDTIEQLTEIVDGNHESLFTAKDTPIWLTVFNRALKNGITNEQFADFMTAFVNELSDKEVDGVTFNDLCEKRNTKDKSTIVGKINYIESLLNGYIDSEK